MLDGLLVDDIGEEELWAIIVVVCMYVERNWLPLFHGCCRCKSNNVCKVKKKFFFLFSYF